MNFSDFPFFQWQFLLRYAIIHLIMIKRRIVPFRSIFKDMAKKKKKNKMPYYIASAMAVLAAASVGLMFYSGGLNPKVDSKEPTVAVQQATQAKPASEFIKDQQSFDYPLMATELNNVYVSANPYGLFSFYSIENGKFVPVESQEMEIKVPCSNQQVPAKLQYVERDGKVCGYGLFLTTLFEDDVRLYNYAFFHLTEMPSNYGSGKMLLVDFDEGDFAKKDKNYTEVFSFDMASQQAKRITSDNGRTVDNLGRLRTDWAQMNEALLQLNGNKLYLTGRNYQLDSATADIVQNNDTSNTKPKLMVSGLWENWMHTENGKTYYAKETENGFDICCMNTSGSEEDVGSYSVSLDSYLFSGDYMLEKNTLALKRISTNENKGNLKSEAIHTQPTAFSVSPDGKKAVVLIDGNSQSVLLFDMTTGQCQLAEGIGLFVTNCDPVLWLADGSFMTNGDNGSTYDAQIWKF